jgi:hypothetical protein
MATIRITESPKDLDAHILQSYSTLRWCMGVLSFMLPLLLVVGGINSFWWISAPLKIQNSLSAYYHAGSMCVASVGVYRDLFVGILAAISFCLIVYTGFGNLENWLLNIAGACLACVAFFPMDWPETNGLSACQVTPSFLAFTSSKLWGLQSVSLHGASASIFFLMITLVNLLTAMDTVNIIKDVGKQKFWRKIFNVARFLMPVSLGLVVLLRVVTGTSIIGDRLILWLEWAGIWAFSFYWLLKSIEIRSTKVDLAIINRNVEWISNGKLRHRKLNYKTPGQG